MSPLRVYTYTDVKRCSYFAHLHILLCHRIKKIIMSILKHRHTTSFKRCWYFAQLHILSFYRIEADKLPVYTYTNIKPCSQLHILSFYRIEADKLPVYTYTNIKRCSYFEQLHILSFYRIKVDQSCPLYVYVHTPTSNVARILSQI